MPITVEINPPLASDTKEVFDAKAFPAWAALAALAIQLKDLPAECAAAATAAANAALASKLNAASPTFTGPLTGPAAIFTGGVSGYGAGAGGTATQSTSKGQTVVMASPKPSGRITMHAAALAAGASIEFGFTNALLASSDGIVVRPDAFTGYSVEAAYFNSATEVILRVTNKGATRSDAVGIVFQIVRGSTT